jgi:hypothetical protein
MLRLLALLLAAITGVLTPYATAAAPTEYDIKAAFIYNFSKFVQWPTVDTSKPFEIGLIGKDPFGSTLDETVRGKHVNGKKVVVRRFFRIEDIVDCDILFVASSEERNLERILKVLQSGPVLTVGDMDQFAERGGMINLVNAGNRVRFDINIEAIERAGLTASSQLLQLARIVGKLRAPR